MERIKQLIDEDKIGMSALFIGVLIVILFGYSYTSNVSEVKALAKQEETMISEINKLQSEADVAQLERQGVEKDSSKELTGYNTDLINMDTKSAEEFFTPAFTWSSGLQYDQIRDSYIESLGADNSFTKVYLQENSKVKVTDKQEANYIDEFEVKTEMGSIDVIPLVADGNSISYVAFVTFYPYTGAKLVDKSVMKSEHAIIRFVASGEEDNRTVSSVEAWGGSSQGIER